MRSKCQSFNPILDNEFNENGFNTTLVVDLLPIPPYCLYAFNPVPGGDGYLWSTPFNISNDSTTAPSTSSSSASTLITHPTAFSSFAASQPSVSALTATHDRDIGLGVGLGLALPIVVAVSVGLTLLFQRQRSRAQPSMSSNDKSTAIQHQQNGTEHNLSLGTLIESYTEKQNNSKWRDRWTNFKHGWIYA